MDSLNSGLNQNGFCTVRGSTPGLVIDPEKKLVLFAIHVVKKKDPGSWPTPKNFAERSSGTFQENEAWNSEAVHKYRTYRKQYYMGFVLFKVTYEGEEEEEKKEGEGEGEGEEEKKEGEGEGRAVGGKRTPNGSSGSTGSSNGSPTGIRSGTPAVVSTPAAKTPIFNRPTTPTERPGTGTGTGTPSEKKRRVSPNPARTLSRSRKEKNKNHRREKKSHRSSAPVPKKIISVGLHSFTPFFSPPNRFEDHARIFFPCGLIEHEDAYIVSYGEADATCRLVAFQKSQVMASMLREIPSEVSELVVPDLFPRQSSTCEGSNRHFPFSVKLFDFHNFYPSFLATSISPPSAKPPKPPKPSKPEKSCVVPKIFDEAPTIPGEEIPSEKKTPMSDEEEGGLVWWDASLQFTIFTEEGKGREEKPGEGVEGPKMEGKEEEEKGRKEGEGEGEDESLSNALLYPLPRSRSFSLNHANSPRVPRRRLPPFQPSPPSSPPRTRSASLPPSHPPPSLVWTDVSESCFLFGSASYLNDFLIFTDPHHLLIGSSLPPLSSSSWSLVLQFYYAPSTFHPSLSSSPPSSPTHSPPPSHPPFPHLRKFPQPLPLDDSNRNPSCLGIDIIDHFYVKEDRETETYGKKEERGEKEREREKREGEGAEGETKGEKEKREGEREEGETKREKEKRGYLSSAGNLVLTFCRRALLFPLSPGSWNTLVFSCNPSGITISLNGDTPTSEPASPIPEPISRPMPRDSSGDNFGDNSGDSRSANSATTMASETGSETPGSETPGSPQTQGTSSFQIPGTSFPPPASVMTVSENYDITLTAPLTKITELNFMKNTFGPYVAISELILVPSDISGMCSPVASYLTSKWSRWRTPPSPADHPDPGRMSNTSESEFQSSETEFRYSEPPNSEDRPDFRSSEPKKPTIYKGMNTPYWTILWRVNTPHYRYFLVKSEARDFFSKRCTKKGAKILYKGPAGGKILDQGGTEELIRNLLDIFKL
jgi:hypothetical protein